jgi:schlafen family protein
MEVDVRSVSPKTASLRFWYGSSMAEFVGASAEEIVGQLTLNSSFDIDRTQAAAWLAEIEFLQSKLSELVGSIFFEFNIPRMGRRIDVILVIGPVVFAIEFKVGEKVFDRPAIDQVWDYGLDLKNFHEASHDASIIPILIATEATESPAVELYADADKLYRPIVVDPASFRSGLDAALALIGGAAVNADAWARASYHPTPTIIEAARALYAQHSVEAIARFDAGAQNLHVTSRRIEELVDEAQAKGRKRICFVTGVPGAGKTLVGLNLATRREEDEPTHAVFLSGNGPLVAVLREALTRDEFVRRKKQGEKLDYERALYRFGIFR